MADNVYECLVILSLPQGGYVVSDYSMSPNTYNSQLFACADIDDALKFIKGHLVGSPSNG